jgi:predicted DNA-binding protein
MKYNINPGANQRITSKLIYSPRIKPEQVNRLYRLRQIESQPMTVHVQQAVEEYLNKKESLYNLGKENINE